MYEIKATKKRVLLWQIYREIPHRLRGDDLKKEEHGFGAAVSNHWLDTDRNRLL